MAGRFFIVWATREAQEYWSGYPIPSPGVLPNPGIEMSCIFYHDFLNAGTPRKKMPKFMSLELLSVPKNPWRGHLIVQIHLCQSPLKRLLFPPAILYRHPLNGSSLFLTFLFFLLMYNLQCCDSFKCAVKWFSYIYMHINKFFFYYRLLQDIEYNSLFYTLGPCWFTLYIVL